MATFFVNIFQPAMNRQKDHRTWSKSLGVSNTNQAIVIHFSLWREVKKKFSHDNQ